MVLLDLKDAYLHVPIHRSDWCYLHIALRDPTEQWKVFGLSTEPQVFTKVILPMDAHLQKQRHMMFPYLDDIFHALASLLQVCLTRHVL